MQALRLSLSLLCFCTRLGFLLLLSVCLTVCLSWYLGKRSSIPATPSLSLPLSCSLPLACVSPLFCPLLAHVSPSLALSAAPPRDSRDHTDRERQRDEEEGRASPVKIRSFPQESRDSQQRRLSGSSASCQITDSFSLPLSLPDLLLSTLSLLNCHTEGDGSRSRREMLSFRSCWRFLLSSSRLQDCRLLFASLLLAPANSLLLLSSHVRVSERQKSREL